MPFPFAAPYCLSVSKQSQRGKIVSELSKVALSGPLERYAEGFADDLARQGYAASVVVIHVRRLAHVSRWLGARGLDASALDEAAGEAFLADRRAAGRSLLLRIGSLAPLLEYLSGIGAAPAPGPVPPAMPADALLARYAGVPGHRTGPVREDDRPQRDGAPPVPGGPGPRGAA